MLSPVAAAIAANRFGLGARPGDLEHLGSDPPGWLNAQLAGRPPLVAGADLQSSASIIAQSLQLRREVRDAKRGDAQVTAFMKLPQLYRPIYISEVTARLQQAVSTDRPFVERLTQFWTNHFAVCVDKVIVLGVAGTLEREAIRPHVLGRFTDLLMAVEQHPAMLLYLDNHISVGPHSMAASLARRRAKRRVGINENLAREILELHTLGVGGGYTQKDVTTFAEVITGWSVGGERGGRFEHGEPGRFEYRPETHEPGVKVVLGKRYPDTGLRQGEAVLRDVAATATAARFIATKLVRHFVADDPPAGAVERVAQAFLASDGDLPTVYRALISCPEAWTDALSKYKTPSDYIVSSFRGLDLPIGNGRGGLGSFEVLGQRTYGPGSPAGWPDKSSDWDGSSALMKRIEWADAVGQKIGDRRDAAAIAPQILGATLSSATSKALGRAASGAQALTLLLAAPEFMRR